MIHQKLEEAYVNIPDCFDEMRTEEWRALLWCRGKMVRDKSVSMEDVRRYMADLMLYLRGVKRPIIMRKASRDLLVWNVAETLDWMIRIEGNEVIIPINTTFQLLPKYENLVGPDGHASNLTFGEFHHAVAAMNLYTKNHDEASLLALCAVLYRPKKHRGKRMPFRSEDMSYLMIEAAKIPEYIRWGIYAWFANLCDYIRTGTFNIYGQELCFAPLFARKYRTDDEDSHPEPEGGDLGMNGILLSVAESGVFGNLEDVQQAPLLSVLMKMLQDYQQAESIKQKSHVNNIGG